MRWRLLQRQQKLRASQGCTQRVGGENITSLFINQFIDMKCTLTFGMPLATPGLSFICLLLVVGCEKNDQRGGIQQDQVSPQVAIKSTADLNRVLVPGMSTNQIITALGQPSWMDSFREGEVWWQYDLTPFAADDKMRGSYVIGVGIQITNGHLFHWGPTYSGRSSPGSAKEEVLFSSGNNKSPTVLKFFVISDGAISGGRFIDTEQFPKLGFIPPVPNLTISDLKEVSLEERIFSGPDGNATTNWTFKVSTGTDGSSQLKSMTTTNISKRILVTIGDEPLLAPVINEPLETGSLGLTSKNREEMERIRRHFVRLQSTEAK
jgi:hypothetical protein